MRQTETECFKIFPVRLTKTYKQNFQKRKKSYNEEDKEVLGEREENICIVAVLFSNNLI